MLGAVEGEFSRHLHVDLAGALQPPFEPLRRALVLDALAGRIRGAADRTERLSPVLPIPSKEFRKAFQSELLPFRRLDLMGFCGILDLLVEENSNASIPLRKGRGPVHATRQIRRWPERLFAGFRQWHTELGF
jgi:hypothetical protein